MDTHISEILDPLCKGRIRDIQAVVVPSAPEARYPGQHLIVNCVYDSNVATYQPERALSTARADIARILQTIARAPWLDEVRSVTVYLLYHKTPGDEQPLPVGQCRSYVYAILREGLQIAPESLDERYMTSNRFFQERSELDRLAKLLREDPRYDEGFWLKP